MKAVHKITACIEKICLFVAVCFLLFICGSIAAQVIVRKLGGTLIWVDEMTRYAFIWLVLFGNVSVAGHGGHITITSFLDMLPDKIHKIVNIVIYLGVTGCGCVLVYAYSQAVSGYKGVTFSVVTAMPMSAHYALITVLMSFIVIASLLYVVDIIGSLKNTGKEDIE